MNLGTLIRLVSVIAGSIVLWYLSNSIGNYLILKIGNLQYRGDKQRIITLGSLITWIIRVVIGVAAVIWVLRLLNIDPSPFIAGAGILGLAVSFGSQNLIRDTINGFFIILENQYDIGDEVKIGAIQGTVESLTLRITRVRDDSGALYIVPNSTISQVANLSDRWSRILYTINVSSKEPLEKLERVISYTKDKLQDKYDKELIEGPRIDGIQAFDAATLKVMVSCKVIAPKKKVIEPFFLLSLKEGVEKENLIIA